MAFPTSPVDGQIYGKYKYNTTRGAWEVNIGPIAGKDFGTTEGTVSEGNHLHDTRYYTEGEVDNQWTNHGSGSNNDVNTDGNTIIDNIYTDDSGHITSLGTRTLSTGVTASHEMFNHSGSDYTVNLSLIGVGDLLFVTGRFHNPYTSDQTYKINLPSSGTYYVHGITYSGTYSASTTIYEASLSQHVERTPSLIVKRVS